MDALDAVYAPRSPQRQHAVCGEQTQASPRLVLTGAEQMLLDGTCMKLSTGMPK
jgi:hypothetical protein